MALWLGCFLLAAGAAWLTRRTMNPDGVSYLDLADAWRHGHWGNALSDYWSPLYSWLLAAWLVLLRPGPAHEYAAVHALNIAVFALALLSFAYLFEALLALAERRAGARWSPTADHALRVLGYGVFAWTSLNLVTVGVVTPDLLAGAVAFLAAGLLARVRLGDGRGSRQALMLGFVLGAGYLTKAVMLPVGIVFLAMLPLAAGRPYGRLLAHAVAGFALVAVPFAVVLSLHAGAPTTGAAASLNRAWFVEGVAFPIWEGDPRHGRPEHPALRLSARPAAYAVDGHVRGSSPLWADPAWWYAGVRHRLELRRQWSALRRNAHSELDIATTRAALVLISVLGAAWLLAGRPGARGLRDQLSVLVPAVAIVLVYLPITTATRYVGAAVAIAAACGIAAIRQPRSRRASKALPALIALAGVVLLIEAVAPLRSVAADAIAGRPLPGTAWDEARAIRAAGVKNGGDVATLGENLGTTYGSSSMRATWARLAGVTIVADVTQPAAYFAARPAARRRLDARLGAHGASALVSEVAPPPGRSPEWRPLGRTGAWIHALPRPGQAAGSAAARARR